MKTLYAISTIFMLGLTACGAMEKPDLRSTSRESEPGSKGEEPDLSLASATSTSCPAGTLVKTAAELKAALTAAKPGAVINLASGTYVGPFIATVSGTQATPITLCGPKDAIIDGKGGSRALHLNGANWWRLSGFQITHSNKGLGLTNASHNVVTDLYIHDTRGASAHINTFSSDNLFDRITIRKSGAEGIYIGSAKGNWCFYSNCQPDTSDRNVIQNGDISGTDDEPIDIKEGSTGGKVLNMHFDGSDQASNKGWVNVKGNNYLIAGNVGVNSPTNGYAVHKVLAGWGNNNTFTGNSAKSTAGYAFYIQGGTSGDQVACGQPTADAALGFSNVACH